MYGVCVNSSDQVTSTSASGNVYMREGISTTEPAGRNFLQLVERTSQEPQKWSMVTNSGANYSSIPRHWISEHVVVVGTSHYRHTNWRKKILQGICAINDASWEVFRSAGNDLSYLVARPEKLISWNREVRAKMRRSYIMQFALGKLRISADEMTFKTESGSVVVKSLAELMSVSREYYHAESVFTIQTTFYSSAIRDVIEIGFSAESERDDWHELLSTVKQVLINQSIKRTTHNSNLFSEIRRRILCRGNCVPSLGMWSVSNTGMLRYHVLSQNSLSALDSCPSLCIPGCMKNVSAGANGIVWSLAHDGAVYSLSPDFDPLSGSALNFSAVQQTTVIKEVMF
ncbi:hypothetical protein KIN20_024766 [Parelaphostrongylus tenuis]|uniref:Uncharacterized protein n=1 Tax=Parelaphostrongylus tenuis TaxID=148309 RepID=A0AAD5NA85_PARTN|nr:hypothetical protein KIN20_024766 [Parelaphostrongylus tenuis]